jgi:RsmE family RNA methyltransferase
VNSIFIYRSEFIPCSDSHGIVEISDSERIRGILDRNPWLGMDCCGRELKAAVEGVGRGNLVIERLEADQFCARFDLLCSPLARTRIILSVAIPRPQTIKKLFQLSAMIGLTELRFFKSDLSEKTYWKSKSLRREIAELEILKALEQSWDAEILRWGIWDSLNAVLAGDNILTICADPEGELSLRDIVVHITSMTEPNKTCAELCQILIGPEMGWSKRERLNVAGLNIKKFSLGQRILRVEVAAALLIGSLLDCFS